MAIDKYLKNKKYVIWDWNGTLLDDRIHTWTTGNALLKSEGRDEVSLQFYLNNFCFPVSEYYKLLGLDVENKEHFKKICHFFVSKYMEKISECSVKPEMKVILENIRARGLKQSILSAADQESLITMVEQQGISNYFENIFGLANKEATCKISRGAELIEILSSNYKKEEMLIVGDTLHDLEVGKENSVDVVLVSHGHNSKDRLVAEHNMVIEV